MANLLVDTSAVILFIKGSQEVREQFRQHDELYLCSIVLGKLLHGAFKSGQQEQELQKLAFFRQWAKLLNTTERTAEIYGQLSSKLALAGTPISANDTWIAAFAMEHGLTLYSKDTDYQRVEGLDFLLLES